MSLHARCIDAKKKDLTLALVNQEGLPVCQTKIKVQGADWKEYKAQLIVTDKYEGELASEATTKEGKLGKNIRFAILPKGEQKVAVDLVSLKPQDTYKGHGLRKDLARTFTTGRRAWVRRKIASQPTTSGDTIRPASWVSMSISSGARIWEPSRCLYWRQVFLVRTLWQMSAEWLVSRAESR